MTSKEITEQQLLDLFEENFQRLRMENGHSLSEDVKEAAKEQVLLYWRRLKEIAKSVTDTEVPLSLPNIRTEKSRIYAIEGIVDIVREAEKVIMYDIKTHESDFVRSHIDLYQPQLNVYAYIWEHLRNEKVSETAVIATQPPRALVNAMFSSDKKDFDDECDRWNPVVKIPFDHMNVEKTIHNFSEIVDKIEDHKFKPKEKERLGERVTDKNTFATNVCRNCDARFSCGSYRDYARVHKSSNWAKFSDFYDLEPDELELDERINTYLEVEDHLDQIKHDIS